MVVADKALLSTDEGRFTELAREIVEAAHYSRELSRNIRDGIAEKLRIRRDVWSHPLLGFERAGEHRTIRPSPQTMPTAVRAFELAAAGISDQSIADQLGVTLWRVRGALRSPLYAGRLPNGSPTTFAPARAAGDLGTRASGAPRTCDIGTPPETPYLPAERPRTARVRLMQSPAEGPCPLQARRGHAVLPAR